MIEGPEAYKRFDAIVDSLLSVPCKTIARREIGIPQEGGDEPEGHRAEAEGRELKPEAHPTLGHMPDYRDSGTMLPLEPLCEPSLRRS
jgi:hypothetical protein